MKKFTYIIFGLFFILIVIPSIIIVGFKSTYIKNNIPKLILDTQMMPMDKEFKIKVYKHDENKVEDMDFEEYIKGVTAAEMPASFEMETLKAQAVAARTYALSKFNKNNPEIKNQHKGADICTNPSHCQAYKNKELLMRDWGILGYVKNWERISTAVEETRNKVIFYNGQLIDPLFHSTSGGKTENAEDVFSTDLPYLKSVASVGEEVSPRFYGRTKYSIKEFNNLLKAKFSNINLSKADVKLIKILERTGAGRVKNMQVGKETLSGVEFRNLFSINSTNFTISIQGDTVVIDTIGYGHGVGMSQFGANYLAKQGKNYIDILKYYYQGVEVTDNKK